MTPDLERNRDLRAAEIKPGTLERVTSNLQGRTTIRCERRFEVREQEFVKRPDLNHSKKSAQLM
jgi:hypothetical protein